METENKLVYSKENYYTENGYKYKIKTTISLDDDCHNNMCDWSITADIRWKNKYGIYKEYMGGCCHDEIARHCPELAKFIPLHGCNHYGAPLYPVENGIYHVKRSGMFVAMEYLRISEQECVELYKASEDKMYFKYMLFNLGIVDRWKRESDELIAELEDLCGKKWVNPYTPEKERFTLTLTDEERLLIEESIKAGYYSAENIEKRREEAHKAKMMELYLHYYLEDDQPNVWLRIKNGIIETSKNIKIGRAEAERLWKLIKFFHNGSKFQHDMVLDTTGHKWKINSYKNDILVAGCHRIAYSEMEGVARQLGWD